MRILIADDHLMFASALQFLLLSLDPATETVPVASVAEAQQRLADDPHFDLVLLDQAMPGTSGIAGLTMIKTAHPQMPVAILSGALDHTLVRSAQVAGAIGWIPKTMSGAPLIHALRLMAAGQAFYPQDLLHPDEPSGFSPREQEVAALLTEGLSDKEIALRLSIQLNTVKEHVKKLLRKSGVSNRTKFALLQANRTLGAGKA